MRIEMRLRCYLVMFIGNLKLVNGKRQVAINNWVLAAGNRKKIICMRQLVIG